MDRRPDDTERLRAMRAQREQQQAGGAVGASGTAQPEQAGVTLHTGAPTDAVGRVGPIGAEDVDRARAAFQKYKSGKATLEARIIENERWFRMRHWEVMRRTGANPNDPEPASAWLLNSISNKHADAMDNYPEASVLPREAGDKNDADMLSAILPVLLEQNGYEQVYSDAWWYKLKMGGAVKGVFWDPEAANGLGDVSVRMIDALNIYWEPGVRDLQRSRNIFTTELADNDLLVERYPFLEGKLSAATEDVPQYVSDEQMDTTAKSVVVDWYYKRTSGTRKVLHYVKYVGREVLYASENDPAYAESGFYAHGQYPFVMDTLFQEESGPFGFGYIDVCKDPQMYIDKLNQVILKHALLASRPRFFVKNNGGVNEAEYADTAKDFVHFEGSNPNESIMQVQMSALNSTYVELMTLKVDELKETSGNRDFSQGGTTSGVTAASAIAALQEAGSKLSRDMIKASYRAFIEETYLMLELIRQFYTEPRSFRIMGDMGAAKFVQYTSQNIRMRQQDEVPGADAGYRMPVFDIKVRANRANPFSRVSQNELALGFFQRGFFNPQLVDQALACMEMMDFEGKDQVTQKIAQNGTLLQIAQQMYMQLMQMGAMIESSGLSGGQAVVATIQQQYAARLGQSVTAGGAAGGTSGMAQEMNSLGKSTKPKSNSTADKATKRTAAATAPQ